jgi:hypothetical protein
MEHEQGQFIFGQEIIVTETQGCPFCKGRPLIGIISSSLKETPIYGNPITTQDPLQYIDIHSAAVA